MGIRLDQQCDAQFSRLIRLRDQRCRRCGSTTFLQCAHLISRRYKAIRWDERNAVALCRECHFWQTHNPLEGEAFFRGLVGDETFDALRQLALDGLPKIDYQLLYVALRQRVQDIEGRST